MSNTELPPDEGLDLPDQSPDSGYDAPTAEVDEPAGASHADTGASLGGDLGDERFGEDTVVDDSDGTDPVVDHDDSDLFGGTEDSPEAKKILDGLGDPAAVTEAQAAGIRDYAEKTARGSGSSRAQAGATAGKTSNTTIHSVNGKTFTFGDGVTVVGDGGVVTSRQMTGREAADFTAKMQRMAADLEAQAAQGGSRNTTHITATGPAEIVVNDKRISLQAGEKLDATFTDGDVVSGTGGSEHAEADDRPLTGDAAAAAHADLDSQLAAARARVEQAHQEAAARTAGAGNSGAPVDVAADDRTAQQQARLEETLRTAQGYRDSAFGPQPAAEETSGDRNDHAPSGAAESTAVDGRQDPRYLRADEQDRRIITREGWHRDDPYYSDGALQERYGRDDARQGELRDAYAAARERYDAALTATDNYWGHPSVGERQAVDREMHLARDQLNAASERLFRNQESVYDTALSDGTRYINGIPVVRQGGTFPGEATGSGKSAETAEIIGRMASAGEQQVVLDLGPRVDYPAPHAVDSSTATLERPHVGERFVETDRSAARTAGERGRLRQLEQLPHNGFTRRGIAQVREQIAALGYPVDNFRVFNHKQNERGTEDTIASWLGHGYGEFTVYDLYNRMIPEKRLGTLGHETAHANSPLKPENMDVFGGAERQAEAARYVDAVARQSLETGIHLNGYHKYLLKEFKTNTDKLQVSLDSGELSQREYDIAHAEATRKLREETWAIMNEMALTNRNGLAEVQARQHMAIEDHNRRAGSHAAMQSVDLITTPGRDGRMPEESRGVDTWLVRLLDGVNNQQELVQHVDNLKQRFYGNANYQKAEHRRRDHYDQAA